MAYGPSNQPGGHGDRRREWGVGKHCSDLHSRFAPQQERPYSPSRLGHGGPQVRVSQAMESECQAKTEHRCEHGVVEEGGAEGRQQSERTEREGDGGKAESALPGTKRCKTCSITVPPVIPPPT